ncbi:LysR family transcriptional regulator [Pseudaestuariivita atlantica]|uniref:LysR family transcriptional regulator n=1 Tax=Pseudaestuariivita atlantica TaxID=1317121 RepID=A0A0L1JUG3_9RHOB|nr:LysR family transcriptional regulator [Pseudaestuariivita atlantica]KNG95332.1 LysR family transcriptional regulator [Pseudaestuariivita atlantica]
MSNSPRRITLWGIEVFVACAEERSVSAAARRLGASVSAVSQQMTNLEDAIGVSLMNRGERPMTLTPAGETFRRRAQAILNEAAQARAELGMADLGALTRFRLGMIEDFEADVTPHLLAFMAEELRGCQFLLDTGASHALYDQLDARALDVIVAAEMGAEAAWMEVHPLVTERYVGAAPRGVIDPDGDIAAQVTALPLVQYTTRHAMGRQIASHLARQNLTVARRFELDSYHAILALVGSGAGWTILTPLALNRATRFSDMIDVFPLPFQKLERTISLIARREILHDMPARVATELRDILNRDVIAPSIDRMPWMQDHLTLHRASP